MPGALNVRCKSKSLVEFGRITISRYYKHVTQHTMLRIVPAKVTHTMLYDTDTCSVCVSSKFKPSCTRESSAVKSDTQQSFEQLPKVQEL